MNKISPELLNRLLQDGSPVTLIDVRSPAEFEAVHIPQARNLPLDRVDAALRESSLGEPPIYLVCHSGARAEKAAAKLAAAGQAAAVVVNGGTQAWVAAGLPVTRGVATTISLERQVRIAAGSLVLLGVLLGTFIHPGFFGLSGFVGAGLVFAGISDWCGMGLLLAKAPWNRRSA